MRYFLDFDRTIFDTDTFIRYLAERPDIGELAREEEMTLAALLEERAKEGTLTFAPGELSQFLYPDAATFLREKENAVTIITFGNPTLQELKAKSALFGIPRMAVMYTGGIRKGEFLAPHTHLHEGAVAVDDSPLELEFLASGCAPIALYEIRRDGGTGDGRWPVIRSLAELP
ncbi:MAG TPA: hypothetical protein VNU25_03875 [Candidatus Paceibacterota bacterium]|nr:hypothetical protein [Candidatus Paceibacterota bacterium]